MELRYLLSPARPRPELRPALVSFSLFPSLPFSSLPPNPAIPHPPPPGFPSATERESNILQLSLPSCSALHSFFIKLPKRQSVEGRTVAKRPACRPSCPTHAGAQLAAPLPRWPACPPLFSFSPVSRCGSSTSSGAIGKQRPRINYPVPSSSLMNK